MPLQGMGKGARAVLERLIEVILPPIISVCELIGIFVVAVSALRAFYQYLKALITRKPTDLKLELAQGLATGLEFKMAAEILKTVLVRTLEELAVLGAVILLRALLSLMIHIEIREGRERLRMEQEAEEKEPSEMK